MENMEKQTVLLSGSWGAYEAGNQRQSCLAVPCGVLRCQRRANRSAASHCQISFEDFASLDANVNKYRALSPALDIEEVVMTTVLRSVQLLEHLLESEKTRQQKAKKKGEEGRRRGGKKNRLQARSQDPQCAKSFCCIFCPLSPSHPLQKQRGRGPQMLVHADTRPVSGHCKQCPRSPLQPLTASSLCVAVPFHIRLAW
jgi:hypothetical protein